MKLSLGKGKKILPIALVVAAAAGGAGYYFWGSGAKAEEYVTAKIERGNVRNTVNATGTLQAVTTVQVGSQVSGIISALYVDFNSVVKKGQLVAQLDPSIFQAQVAQQRANVEAARANLADAQARLIAAEVAIENQRAGVSSALANLEALKAMRDDAKSNVQRQESLASSGLINQRDMDIARTSFQSADARYNQATAQLAQARATEQQAARAGLAQAQAAIKQAQAQVQQTSATLRLAEVNLSHTTIHSPIDGVVVSRNVDVGQTVAASLQAPTLFTIANDLTLMQVIANIDQADIGVINSANRIGFTVDAFPGQQFNGKISQIRLNPQNVQNVVTYNVVIDVSNPELKLKPGMTANLTVTIAERNDVLKVPNAALRFRPADITQEKLREMMRGDRPEQPAPAATPAEQKKPDEKAAAPDQKRRGDRAAAAPDQKKPGEQPAAAGAPSGERRRENGAGSGPPSTAVIQGQRRIVWVLGPDKKPQPRRIRIGITDGVNSEIAEGELKEGDTIIVAQNITSDARPATSRAPGFGGPGGPGGGGRPR
ncbi:MAG: efflux RND transporter periplasmic adaptor subunit [Blastocatellia bacterium]|nr:efflux RND transporter periplasmic adaptor subunit [Blastocatellia bacterium]